MKLRNTVICFSALCLGMTAYVSLMGLSSNRGSAIALYDFSEAAISNWYKVATALSVPLSNTQPGKLQPVVSEKFSALDLVVYGYELVTPDYKQTYRQLDLPRMVGQLQISANEEEQLQYHVAGLQLLTLRDMDGEHGAVFFMDVPYHIIDHSSQRYDNTPAIGTGDNEGTVRYSQLDDGRYVMGLFLPYQR